MNRKEQTRLMVLAQVDRADLTAAQAVAVLDLSRWRIGSLQVHAWLVYSCSTPVLDLLRHA
ncbi:MAG: hypothetical protein HY689_02745 [Chloroflexi bacterium]|nr:hypothetical protein [Chloroflexota bacterium]